MRRTALLAAAVPLLLAAAVTTADAQGKKGHPHGGPPGQMKKRVSTDDAVSMTRVVLVEHGFTVLRVERVYDGQVVYYRKGKKGAEERILVRPTTDRVVFERAPQPVLMQVNLRLGL